MERRSFLLSLIGASLAPGFARAAHDTCAATDARAAWRLWKTAFLMPDGRVVDHLQRGASHSESQGYGLVLATFHGDREAFDRIFLWTEANLTRRGDGLLNWRLHPDDPEPEENNATDGDIFYAWGLALGARRFELPQARSRAAEIARAVAEHCIVDDPRNAGRLLLMPAAQGFRRGIAVIVNPSYIMPRALFDLARLVRDQRLSRAAEDGLRLLDELAAQGLVPDWVHIDPLGVSPSFEHPVASGYDALRVPLYLIWSGNRQHPAVERSRQMYERLASAETPVVTDLEGSTMMESSSYAGFNAIRHLVRQTDADEGAKHAASFDPGQGYYPATLELLAAVARKETAPLICPT